VTCSVGGTAVPVLYAGVQGAYAGLDQINVRLPSSLSGAGLVALRCLAGTVNSNAVTLLLP